MNTIPPFAPQPFEQLRQRWPAALATVYDRNLLEAGRQGPPGLQPQHRFDFADGIRLIVSLDKCADVELHLSFGIHVDHQPVWLPRGQAVWLARCDVLVAELRAAGLITGQQVGQRFVTPRAAHYWFKGA